MQTTQDFKNGQEVLFNGAMCVCTILTIKKKTAIVWEKSTKKAYTKKLTSLRHFKPKKVKTI